MTVKSGKNIPRMMRHLRVRRKVTGVTSRPRLAVFRSSNHIYAQVIDDSAGHTLAAAGSHETALREKAKSDAKGKALEAVVVGTAIAERALAAGIKEVIFDRGGYKYHGRVKALADAARAGGLGF